MFMPAGNDDPNVKMGGLGKKVLGDVLEILEFPDMVHGWTVRGDLVNMKNSFKFLFSLKAVFIGSLTRYNQHL